MSLLTGHTWFLKGSRGTEVHVMFLLRWGGTRSKQSHSGPLVFQTAHYSANGFSPVPSPLFMHQRIADQAPANGHMVRYLVTLDDAGLAVCIWLLSIHCSSLFYSKELHQRLLITWRCVNHVARTKKIRTVRKLSKHCSAKSGCAPPPIKNIFINFEHQKPNSE